MTDLGNKVMESMFDAWCDDECFADGFYIAMAVATGKIF